MKMNILVMNRGSASMYTRLTMYCDTIYTEARSGRLTRLAGAGGF